MTRRMDDTMPLFMKEKLERESSKEKEIEGIVKELVLPFLPAKSLFKFKCVSKKWCQRITNPFLAHQQSYYFQKLSGFFYQHYGRYPALLSLDSVAHGVPTPSLTFMLEDITIVDSCNGLLLCQGCLDYHYYICNPATKNWQTLPDPELYHRDSSTLLAFDSSPLNMVPHYKLISAVPLPDYPLVRFETYTSDTGSWTVSEALCPHELTLTSNRFYLNGVAYWETSSRDVLAFDLVNELDQLIPLQDQIPPNGILTQIRGELHYIALTKDGDSGTEYLLMIYGGMDLSFKRSINMKIEHGPCSCLLSSQFRVLPCLDGEEVMISKGGCLFSYSLREGTVKMIKRVPLSMYGADKILGYVNSLAHVASS